MSRVNQSISGRFEYEKIPKKFEAITRKLKLSEGSKRQGVENLKITDPECHNRDFYKKYLN